MTDVTLPAKTDDYDTFYPAHLPSEQRHVVRRARRQRWFRAGRCRRRLFLAGDRRRDRARMRHLSGSR